MLHHCLRRHLEALYRLLLHGIPPVHRSQVPPQREPRAKDPTAKLAGTRPKVLIVQPLLVVLQRNPILQLLATNVAGRDMKLPSLGRMPTRHVSSQSVHITQLIPADVAHILHAPVHLLMMQLPPVEGVEDFWTLVTGDVLHGADMLVQRGLAVKDLPAGLAGLVVVLQLEVLPQGELGEAVAMAEVAGRGADTFLGQFAAKSKAIQ